MFKFMKKGGNGMDRSNSNHTYNGPSKALPLSLFDVKNELKQKSKLIPSDTMYKLTKEEQLIINKIKIQTEQLNKNNVTRTRAYYQFYIQYPEIHWALLGAGFSSYDGEFRIPLVLAQGSPIFHSSCEGKLGIALE